MKLKSIFKVALAAVTFAATSIALAGGPAAPMDPTQNNIHGYISGSAYFGHGPLIGGGTESFFGTFLEDNINQKSTDTSFIPELGLWFPIWSNHQNMIVNFVTFTNWIPGGDTMSSGHQTILFNTPNEFRSKLHTNMWDIGIGLNFLRYFAHRWFGLLMIGGGANYADFHADFYVERAEAIIANSSGDASIYRPFVTAKIGVGTNLSKQSQILIFGRYTSASNRTLTVDDDTPIVASTIFSTPNNWWDVGVQFTRSFTS